MFMDIHQFTIGCLDIACLDAKIGCLDIPIDGLRSRNNHQERFLVSPGTIWEVLGVFGGLWEHLGAAAQYLQMALQLRGTSGTSWKPLGASGGLWESLEPLVSSRRLWKALGASLVCILHGLATNACRERVHRQL